jgi:hypothetical protein
MGLSILKEIRLGLNRNHNGTESAAKRSRTNLQSLNGSQMIDFYKPTRHNEAMKPPSLRDLVENFRISQLFLSGTILAVGGMWLLVVSLAGHWERRVAWSAVALFLMAAGSYYVWQGRHEQEREDARQKRNKRLP